MSAKSIILLLLTFCIFARVATYANRNISLRLSSHQGPGISAVQILETPSDFGYPVLVPHGTLSKLVVSFETPLVLIDLESEDNSLPVANLYEFEFHNDLLRPPLS